MLKQKEFDRSDVDFMYIGFNDACLNFTIDFYRHDLVTFYSAVLHAVPSYNNFVGRVFVEEFKKVQSDVDSVSFGREGSPVCYIYLKPTVSMQQAEKIMKSFSMTDEHSITLRGEYLGHTIRLWWD